MRSARLARELARELARRSPPLRAIWLYECDSQGSGGVAERPNAPVLKPAVVVKVTRGFESHPAAPGAADALAGETAWAAVYRNRKLVAGLAEDQQGDNDSGLL